MSCTKQLMKIEVLMFGINNLHLSLNFLESFMWINFISQPSDSWWHCNSELKLLQWKVKRIEKTPPLPEKTHRLLTKSSKAKILSLVLETAIFHTFTHFH